MDKLGHRHSWEIYIKLCRRLADFDAEYGDLPAHDGLWEAAETTAHDLLARLAIVPLVLEARGLDVTPPMIANLRRIGDGEEEIDEDAFVFGLPHLLLADRQPAKRTAPQHFLEAPGFRIFDEGPWTHRGKVDDTDRHSEIPGRLHDRPILGQCRDGRPRDRIDRDRPRSTRATDHYALRRTLACIEVCEIIQHGF